MSLALRQKTGSMAEPPHPDFGTQSLCQCFYLLEKSLNRYEHLKGSGAPDLVVDTEKVLIARQLQFLSKLSEELTKQCQNRGIDRILGTIEEYSLCITRRTMYRTALGAFTRLKGSWIEEARITLHHFRQSNRQTVRRTTSSFQQLFPVNRLLPNVSTRFCLFDSFGRLRSPVQFEFYFSTWRGDLSSSWGQAKICGDYCCIVFAGQLCYTLPVFRFNRGPRDEVLPLAAGNTMPMKAVI